MTDTADALREMTMLLERAVDDGRFGLGSKLEAKVVTMCRAARRTLSAPAGAARDGAFWLMYRGLRDAAFGPPDANGMVLVSPLVLRDALVVLFDATEGDALATEAAAGTPADMPPQEWVREYHRLALAYGRACNARRGGIDEVCASLDAHVLSRVAESDDVAELRKALTFAVGTLKMLRSIEPILDGAEHGQMKATIEAGEAALSSTADANG
jgi:hypothetical protein